MCFKASYIPMLGSAIYSMSYAINHFKTLWQDSLHLPMKKQKLPRLSKWLSHRASESRLMGFLTSMCLTPKSELCKHCCIQSYTRKDFVLFDALQFSFHLHLNCLFFILSSDPNPCLSFHYLTANVNAAQVPLGPLLYIVVGYS